jgi:hypothetical protein
VFKAQRVKERKVFKAPQAQERKVFKVYSVFKERMERLLRKVRPVRKVFRVLLWRVSCTQSRFAYLWEIQFSDLNIAHSRSNSNAC